MRRADYRLLEAAILDDWKSAIASFAASAANKRVYAVAALFVPDNVHPALYLNTEAGFDRIVARYPNESLVALRRFGGTRWNPPDFAHVGIAPESDQTARLVARFNEFVSRCSDEESETHDERNVEMLVRLMHRLTPSFAALDRTEDFVAYVRPLDASRETWIEFTRITVKPKLFERLFPEISATARLMTTIARQPKHRQAVYWADALRDLILDTATPATLVLKQLGRTRFDACDALVNVGKAAIPELVRLAEEHALAEEWNKRRSAEWKLRGASTRDGSIASSALLALQEFEGASDDIIERLRRLLQKIHTRDRSLRHAGVNGQLMARAMHALRPDEFPLAEWSDRTNHLLNFAAYGVREDDG